jgi:hypothetical protein
MQRHWVRVGGEPFLDRLQIVQTPWFSVLLTKIHSPDTGRDPHDHSRQFASLILSGAYWEQIYTNPADLNTTMLKFHPRWSWHVMPSAWAHKITNVSDPLWTLVFAGKHLGTWSFWTQDGKVDWKNYDMLA